MRIGTLAYATDQGLGVLAKSFYDAGVVTDVLVVRHHTRQTHDEWYPNSPQTAIRPFNEKLAQEFCAQMDVMLFFETPFEWSLLQHCKRLGVRTALMPMYECMPKELPFLPDLYICPSALDLQYFPSGVFVPVPVDVPWKKRHVARKFVHNAGHGGLKGRNGTRELMEALRYVTKPIEFVLRSQVKLDMGAIQSLMRANRNLKLVVQEGTVLAEELYADGDVFVFPEKFNGLSLPLQEAFASGMAVICTDRFPMNTWLPRAPMVRTSGYNLTSVSGRCVNFSEAVVAPRDIAQAIDQLYNEDISELSQAGLEWAQANSWANLKPRYMELLCK